MDGIVLNVNDLDMKKLTQQSATSQQQQHLSQVKQQQQAAVAQAVAASVANSVTISSDDITNVHHSLVGGTHAFVSLDASTSANQQASHHNHHHHQHHQQQQPTYLQSTAAATSQQTIMLDPNDIQNLYRENQKLSSVARICIHLVDRCRTLNKSKQFTEDMNKLAVLIEDFNRTSARNVTGSLPTFGNAGLVFGNGSAGPTTLTTTITPANSIASSTKQQQQQTALLTNNNIMLIPIQGATGGHHQQSHLLQHFITTNDDEDEQNHSHQHQQQHNSRDNKSHHSKHSNRKLNLNVIPSQQQQQDTADELHQQSILFKKLTESGQIIAAELTSDKETSPHSGTNQGGNQMLAIPLNLNDQNALFSIVNQIDNSNIENTPNINNKPTKVYKCTMCSKVFANSYNLNRHMKSHTGFQPYECFFQDCRKRFNYNYHLKRHMETHTGERPFVCTWPNCDQRFNRKYNLNRHLWIHTEHKNKQHAAAV